jgi:hypothetical protein
MSVPSPAELHAKIAKRAGVSTEVVGTVLKAQGLSLVPVAPPKRALDIRRLSFRGVRVNTAWDGPFEASFDFGNGVTALITDQNLRGKSSVLELITWALRGSPRRLRADVRPWFERIVLEYSVNGTPMAVMLRKHDSAFFADILRAVDEDVLRSFLTYEDVPAGSVHVIAGGLSEAEFRDQQDQIMMSLLSFEPITNFQLRQNSDQGQTRENTWPAYFGGIYLPPASSDALFGDTVFAALPARILQMFCNVPLMGIQIRLTTMGKLGRQDEANQNRRVAEDAGARAIEREALVSELAGVEERLAALPTSVGRSYEVVVAELGEAERALELAAADNRNAGRTYDEAKAARQAEQLRADSQRETELAEALFQGLMPKVCPRCEQGIETQRTVLDVNEHQCAVCTKPIPTSDSGTDEEGEPEEAGDALEALRQAEEAARVSAADAAAAVLEARAEVEQLAAELAGASRSDEFSNRMSLQLERARLEGRIQSVPEGPRELEPSETLRVIEAAAEVLTAVTGETAWEMFADLNAEILALGQKFGIGNLDKIELNRQGGMKVTTAGVDAPFVRVSGGERLRLRVAVVIALLRVGARSGVGSHPGLLMLDSPGSDELTVNDEATLLRELDSLKDELPELQVLIASAEPAAVQGQLREDAIYSNLSGGPLW